MPSVATLAESAITLTPENNYRPTCSSELPMPESFFELSGQSSLEILVVSQIGPLGG